MFFVNVFLKPALGAEYVFALVTSIPVPFLLVFQAEPALVIGPSGIAPATFYFVCVRVAVVEVLPHSIIVEGPSTACRHGGWEMS